MILPDINVLIPAIDRQNKLHERASIWLRGVEQEGETLAIPDLVVAGTVRVLSNPLMGPHTIQTESSMAFFDDLLSRDHVRAISAGPRFQKLFARALNESGFSGPAVTDAHLAALAAEHGCVVASNDRDFQKIKMVRSFDPLEAADE